MGIERKELVEKLRHYFDGVPLVLEAADAIEELQKRVPPVPHGRLIDADAFLALINDSTILPDFLKCIINPLIRGEPTVIDAEEGE